MNKLFIYINVLPLPLWFAMMFAPRHKLTERASRSSTVFVIMAAHYVLTLVLAVGTKSQKAQGGSMTSLDGLKILLGTRPGALAAWAHMLALDLFTGAWIYRQCMLLGAPAWVRISSLLGTLMAGPIGLLFFLIWRTTVGRQQNDRDERL